MSLEKALNLKQGESVLYIARQFPISYIGAIALTFALIVGPFFFLFPLFSYGLAGVVVFFAVIAAGIAYGARKMVVWYYNVLAVTGRRVIDIEQKGLFNRTVSIALYEDIEDCSYRIKGVLATIFKYGTVLIETRGAGANLEARQVRHPHILQDLINELCLAAKSAKGEDQGNELFDELKQKLTIDEIKQLIKALKREERDAAVKSFLEESGED